MFRKIGPGMLIAAAFIGPGTVTVCTLAGVGFGYSLLWALLLAILATLVLQEMSARLGLVTRLGLADIIRIRLGVAWFRWVILGLIFSAIVVGNAAYEAGNIGGGALGLEALFGSSLVGWYPWIIGIFAFSLLWVGNYRILERFFVGLVLLMSLSFLLTAWITHPQWIPVLKGLLIPQIPAGGLLTILALVGTTVVPYNLFLHTSLVQEKWSGVNDLPAARRDTLISISLGGIVSMAIVVCAAAIPGGEVKGVFDLAKGLEPLYGAWARYFMGIGLLAAGMSSAITAPLAAAYVANSCFGWNAGMKDYRFRMVAGLILFLGVISLGFGISPVEVIQFAQVANGLLLPLIAIFLLWAVNQSGLMGKFRNRWSLNLIAGLIILLSLILGIRSILLALGNL